MVHAWPFSGIIEQTMQYGDDTTPPQCNLDGTHNSPRNVESKDIVFSCATTPNALHSVSEAAMERVSHTDRDCYYVLADFSRSPAPDQLPRSTLQINNRCYYTDCVDPVFHA